MKRAAVLIIVVLSVTIIGLSAAGAISIQDGSGERADGRHPRAPGTIYVGGTGAGNYSTIQAGIDETAKKCNSYDRQIAAPKGLTPHDPIYIFGNSDFTAANGVTAGSGTESDPYIIEGWDISSDSLQEPGIEIVSTNVYFVISNCYIHHCACTGIDFYNVVNGIIENVVFKYNYYADIQFESSSGNTITNCTSENPDHRSILLEGSSNNNHITYCTITNSNLYGIQISSFHGASTWNIIYHNNLINNNKNAYDECSNFWDNGEEGNYWGDYTGNDVDDDGIGDTSYYISSGSNQDRYPLMAKVGERPVTSFIYSPSYPTVNDVVQFNDASNDPDGTIVAWLWDFGDGTNSTLQNSTHQYTTNWNYTVILKVIDDDGNVDVDKKIIIVDSLPPTSFINLIAPYWRTSTPFTISATATDDWSGVANVSLYYRYAPNNVTWCDWVLFSIDSFAPWSWEFRAINGNGHYQFYSIAIDNIGRIENAPSIADGECGVNETVEHMLHAPIYISGNSGFTAANGVTSGSGTESDPYIIENWDINASSGYGIEVRGTDKHFIIRNCYVHDCSGIYFYSVRNGKIDKVISYNNNFGICFSAIYSTTINKNQITNSTIYNNGCGIYFSSYSSYYSGSGRVNNNQIVNCTVRNNAIGIHLYSHSLYTSAVSQVTYNTIKNCYIYNNSNYGVFLESTYTPSQTAHNQITNSSIYNNQNYGVHLYSAYYGEVSNNYITYSLISDNGYGIYTSHGVYNGGGGNFIHHNDFIANTHHAYDGWLNNWNTSSEGNYWDDYAGADNNGDGIGDTPYDVIGGNNKDYYPLMSPLDFFHPTISLTYPNNGDIAVSKTIISITFSESMNKTSVEGNISISPLVAISAYEWSGSNTKVTLTLSVPLSINTYYTVTINTNVKDLAGNNLQSPYQFSFTTTNIMEVYEDWGIVNTEEFTNSTFIMNGNLTILNGGNLTFKNITLKMNCTYDGQYHIEVQDGSELYIYNNSVIRNGTSHNHFLFWVRDGAKFEMRDSELHECGYDEVPHHYVHARGLYIQSNNAIIEQCLISSNYYAIICDQSSPTIKANIITSNTHGISCIKASPTIINNTISHREWWSIHCYDNSSPDICNNSIIGGYYGIYCYTSAPKIIGNVISNCSIGIYGYDHAQPTIQYNTITDNGNAVSCGWSSDLLISNTQISDNINGIGCGPSSWVTVINCTITNSSQYDIIAQEVSIMNCINTTFNKNKVYVIYNSTLNVSWYINVNILWQNNAPIENANVTIQNNMTQEVFADTTGLNGWVEHIALQEYSQNHTSITYFTPHTLTATKNGISNYTIVNITASQTISIILTDNIGPTAPDVHLNPSAPNGQNNWYTSNINFSASNSTDIGIGVSHYQYSFDGRDWFNSSYYHLINDTSDFDICFRSVDLLGNTGEICWANDTKLDKTNPTDLLILINNGANYINSTTAILTLSAFDNISGLWQTCLSNDNVNWSTWESYATVKTWNLTGGDGTKYVYFKVKDYAGNVAEVVCDTITLDTRPPEINVTGVADNVYYNVSITPTIEITELNLNSSTITLNGAQFISGTTITTEGNYVLVVEATDKAGNYARKNISFTIDKTFPNITITGVVNATYYNTSVTPTINITDLNLNISTMTLNDTPFISGTTITVEGTYVLVVAATDKAGNSARKNLSFTIDLAHPTTSAHLGSWPPQSETGWYYFNEILINLTATDNLSGVARSELRYDFGGWMECGIVKLYLLDGVHVIEYRSIDYAGNIEPAKNITIKIDATAPRFKILDDESGTVHERTFVLHWQGIDEDIVYYEVRINDGPWVNVGLNTSYKFTLSERYNELAVRATDKAGQVTYRPVWRWYEPPWPIYEIIAVGAVIIILIASLIALMKLRKR